MTTLANELRSTVSAAMVIYAYGSAARQAEAGDIDLAMIVSDGTDRCETIRAIAGLLARHSVERGILVSCFPVEEAVFTAGASQFIKNVRADGRAL